MKGEFCKKYCKDSCEVVEGESGTGGTAMEDSSPGVLRKGSSGSLFNGNWSTVIGGTGNGLEGWSDSCVGELDKLIRKGDQGSR